MVCATCVKEQVEVLECFAQQETFHAILQTTRPHITDTREAARQAGSIVDIFKNGLAHMQIEWVPRGLIEIVGRLDELGPQWIETNIDGLAVKVKAFWQGMEAAPDVVEHEVAFGSFMEVAVHDLQAGPERAQTVDPCGHERARAHVHVSVEVSGRVSHMLHDAVVGVFKHDEVLWITKEDMGFQEVFKKRVDPCAGGRRGVDPLPGLDIDDITEKVNVGPSVPQGLECTFREALIKNNSQIGPISLSHNSPRRADSL